MKLVNFNDELVEYQVQGACGRLEVMLLGGNFTYIHLL
jgi:hypothetical protein